MGQGHERGSLRPLRQHLPFADRFEAGQRLATLLASESLSAPVVLALPRGGVPVGRAVADALAGTLDVLVVRKLGAPWQPEFGIGALAEGDDPYWDEPALRRAGVTSQDCDDLLAREREELERRCEAYRAGRALPDLTGRDVVVVDDGVARGVTARAALRRVRREAPHRLLLAVPVGTPDTIASLAHECDAIRAVLEPRNLRAVGEYYDDFRQTTDDEVRRLLSG